MNTNDQNRELRTSNREPRLGGGDMLLLVLAVMALLMVMTLSELHRRDVLPPQETGALP